MRPNRRTLARMVAGMLALGITVLLVAPSPAQAVQKQFILYLDEDRGGVPCVTQVDTTNDGSFNGGDLILENHCDVSDANGNRMGEYSTVVTVLGETGDGPGAFVDCVVTLNDGSKLHFTGPGKFADVATTGIDLVVTAGTRRYKGAEGEVNIVHVTGMPAKASFRLTGV